MKKKKTDSPAESVFDDEDFLQCLGSDVRADRKIASLSEREREERIVRGSQNKVEAGGRSPEGDNIFILPRPSFC